MNKFLISAPVLCNADCKVIFTKTDIKVIRNKQVIMRGSRDPETNSWLLPLNNKPSIVTI